MKNKYHCNPVNKYLDISKLDLEKWKRAGALLGLGLDGNLILLEKPNYTDEGNGKEALFDDGKYRKVYTIDEVDKLLKDLNISGNASIKEVADTLSKFQSSQEAINTELHNKDVAQDKRMDELVKDISTNTANIEGTDSKVETNKVDIQYIKDNYLNKDNVNTLASKEEVKAVKDITEVNRGLIDDNRKDINSKSPYEITIGEVADDQVFATINLLTRGWIETDTAIKRLKFKLPNNQVCINNQQVIRKCLKFIGMEEVK